MSGCSVRQVSQSVSVDASGSSALPSNSPLTARPRNWLHSESVWRSYMTMAFRISLPETPKVRVRPSNSRAYTMPVKQSGHQVTAIGLPPTVSFTISRLLRKAVP